MTSRRDHKLLMKQNRLYRTLQRVSLVVLLVSIAGYLYDGAGWYVIGGLVGIALNVTHWMFEEPDEPDQGVALAAPVTSDD